MKLALFQFAPFFGNVPANLERMAAAVCAHDADLWVMPELATTGYLFADRSECSAMAEPAAGRSLAAFTALCRRRSTRIVVGFAERDGERIYNAAAYVTPSGVASVYRKVHLFDRERDCFDPGPDPFRTELLGEHRLGLMICFDWLFPEAARSLALLGADLVAHPANLVLPYCQAAMVTRALENGVFCATANRVGRECRAGTELSFTGGSQIIDPRGNVLARADAESETVVLADVDLAAARDKSVTPRNDRLADRRPECYVRAGDGLRR